MWVLNTLIGKSMEAPEDVPSIEGAREALNIKRNPTVAELLKQRVSKAVRHTCHKEIDPLGLGLENFAQFGEWRTNYPDMTPVVASGEMPNGKAFKSPREMKTLLLELYGDDIAKTLRANSLPTRLAVNFSRMTDSPLIKSPARQSKTVTRPTRLSTGLCYRNSSVIGRTFRTMPRWHAGAG